MLGDKANKLERSLDLTAYLNYLPQIFCQSTSDSDSDDSGPQSVKQEDVKIPKRNATRNSAVSVLNNAPGSSSSSRSSSKSNFNFTPSSVNSIGDCESSTSARTVKSTTSSGTGNSVSSSGTSTDEEEDCSDLDLTPISDLDFNIFLDHKLWKKSSNSSDDFLLTPPEYKKAKRTNTFIDNGQSSKTQTLTHGTLDRTKSIVGNAIQADKPTSSITLLSEAAHANENGSDGLDDNDSLSEYVNMAANTALVLDPYFKHEAHSLIPNSSNALSEDLLGQVASGSQHSSKLRNISEQKRAKTIESMNIKRRRLYVLICKKEIGKTQKTRANNRKEMLNAQRKLVFACSNHFKQKELESQKSMKESSWKVKKYSRESQSHWIKSDRDEREFRKRQLEMDEQRRIDFIEAKSHGRKVNFLITQAELYAQLLANKSDLLDFSVTEQVDILSHLESSPTDCLDSLNYDVEDLKKIAIKNVENADKIKSSRVQRYNLVSQGEHLMASGHQPEAFQRHLTGYQLKGLDWLSYLYSQGINGILADEEGLGKKVQSIALLGRVAESYGIGGPFLVVAHNSALQDWLEEFKIFLPSFNVVPYWGNPQERNALTDLWQLNNVHFQDSRSFHVIVTSYQVVVADIKYFNRVKWQHVIFDEAQTQALKSASRWKLFLSLHCRSRLLLTENIVQNTLENIWCLLHFIMPSLFDHHDGFKEVFLKDSQIENESCQDQNFLSRLRIVLNTFVLRRIKTEVDLELVDKIEAILYCPLMTNQRKRYTALRKKILVDDLFKLSACSNSRIAQHTAKALLNLVSQFVKVCNHPNLTEPRPVQSPFYMPPLSYCSPRLITQCGLLQKQELILRNINIYNPVNITESLFSSSSTPVSVPLTEVSFNSNWSFTRFIGLSPSDLHRLIFKGALERWNQSIQINRRLEALSIISSINWDQLVEKPHRTQHLFNIIPPFLFPSMYSVLQDLFFVKRNSTFSSFTDEKILRTPETIEHRRLRSRNYCVKKEPGAPKIIDVSKNVQVHTVRPTEIPLFLYNLHPKVRCGRPNISFSALQGRTFPFESQSVAETKMLPSMTTLENPFGFYPPHGLSHIVLPDTHKLVTASGKLLVLDNLLKKLKTQGHRALIYTRMRKMMHILEEFLRYRKWVYLRLDSSSRIPERKQMVSKFHANPEIFVFLLSTRTKDFQTSLTAADTVIFYDSDWDPAIDQQAVNRSHCLGQTKPVTVYRLICKGTIEEGILETIRTKSEIHRLVTGDCNLSSDSLKPAEVVSLLIEDNELGKNSTNHPFRKSAQKSTIGRHCVGSSASAFVAAGVKRKYPTCLDELEMNNSGAKKMGFHLIESNDQSSVHSSKSLLEVEGGQAQLEESQIRNDLGEEYDDEMEETYSNNDEDDCDDETDPDEFDDYDILDGTCLASQSNTESMSDTEDDFGVLSRPKLGRGNGKRGRPPLRVRTVMREVDGESYRGRGPGRPRIKPIGPPNQGIRGRGPGRPPLTRKPETPCSSLSLNTNQNVFSFYSTLDLDPC